MRRSISTQSAVHATVQQVSIAPGAYGLPVACSPLEKAPVTRQKVGARLWDLVLLSNVKVVGPYRSSRDGGQFSDLDKLVGPAWRYTFGKYDAPVGAYSRQRLKTPIASLGCPPSMAALATLKSTNAS